MICKTYVCINCLSVLSVCTVCNNDVLWPNSWMDQDATWHGGRPRPRPHCVSWGPSSPSPKGHSPSPQFSVHICCGQMAGWIKMLLGKEVGRKKSYKCVIRLARRLFHHTALSNVAAPDSQCTPTLAAFGKPS